MPYQVLVIDDEELVRSSIAERLSDEGFSVDVARDAYAAEARLKRDTYQVALLDIRMPGMDGLELLRQMKSEYPQTAVIMMSGHGTLDTAIQALRLGADDFLKKPVRGSEFVSVVRKALKTQQMRVNRQLFSRKNDLIKTVSESPTQSNRIIGTSDWSDKVRNQIRLVVEARCDTILITGETGTGKEIVARAIHEQYPESDSPFIAVSCPALPDSLVESELFGHVKGAFTGATEEREGCFAMADGGTLFLDEVGDLSLPAQAKMLRALETRRVRKVGGTTEKETNVRVVTATNVPLQEAVAEGRFRSDLYYRMNLFSIQTEPLRNRREDIMLLARHFLNDFSAKRGSESPGFAPQVETALLEYDFPGNARELKNIVERAAILSGGELITMEHVEFPADDDTAVAGETPAEVSTGPLSERERIRIALERVKWNRREAAQILNMPYSTLRYKIEKLDIK